MVAAEPNEIPVRQTGATDLEKRVSKEKDYNDRWRDEYLAKGVAYQHGPHIRFKIMKDPVIRTNESQVEVNDNDDHYKPAQEETFSNDTVPYTLCKTFHKKDKFSMFVWLKERNSNGWRMGAVA